MGLSKKRNQVISQLKNTLKGAFERVDNLEDLTALRQHLDTCYSRGIFTYSDFLALSRMADEAEKEIKQNK